MSDRDINQLLTSMKDYDRDLRASREQVTSLERMYGERIDAPCEAEDNSLRDAETVDVDAPPVVKGEGAVVASAAVIFAIFACIILIAYSYISKGNY